MGSRFRKFKSVFGENWHVGRYLLPRLQAIGADTNGVVLDLACGESPFKGFFRRRVVISVLTAFRVTRKCCMAICALFRFRAIVLTS